jgi:hypothetical protein
VVLATPWKSFSIINTEGKIIIDCWRMLKDREELKKKNQYIPLGIFSLNRPNRPYSQ